MLAAHVALVIAALFMCRSGIKFGRADNANWRIFGCCSVRHGFGPCQLVSAIYSAEISNDAGISAAATGAL
jgi:hypothetical protein